MRNGEQRNLRISMDCRNKEHDLGRGFMHRAGSSPEMVFVACKVTRLIPGCSGYRLAIVTSKVLVLVFFWASCVLRSTFVKPALSNRTSRRLLGLRRFPSMR